MSHQPERNIGANPPPGAGNDRGSAAGGPARPVAHWPAWCSTGRSCSLRPDIQPLIAAGRHDLVLAASEAYLRLVAGSRIRWRFLSVSRVTATRARELPFNGRFLAVPSHKSLTQLQAPAGEALRGCNGPISLQARYQYTVWRRGSGQVVVRRSPQCKA